MQRLIRVSTICNQFSLFSIGISKFHCQLYLKLKLDSSKYIVWEILFSIQWVILFVDVSKICWMSGKQCRPRSDAGSTLCTQACLFEYLGPASVAKCDALPTGDQEVAGRPLPGRQHSFVEIDHDIFSKVIFSLLLIQEVQLSVSSKIMCTILVNCLED